MADRDRKREIPSNGTSSAEIEREIRSHRRFSLAEAIGRSAGGLLRGASPVSRKRQAEFTIEEAIDRHLVDSEGAMAPVLVREVRQSEEFLESYDDPLAALRRAIERILHSEEILESFVKSVDAEWGRIYHARPRFDSSDEAPEKDDPYTSASVRRRLVALVKSLARESRHARAEPSSTRGRHRGSGR